MCKSCKLRTGSSKFVVDLIVLGIKDFDIILGMDWLSTNYIPVNCREKKNIVNSLGKEPIVCFEGTMAMLALIISVVEALMLLIKGCSGYLAYVMDGKKITPALEKILVVKDSL